MYFYDEPLTDEFEALFLEIDKESKKKASLKPVNSNNDTCGPIFPSFESLSQQYKEEFTKHLIDCYPTITQEQIASVDQALLMEVHKMLPSTSLKRAILIAQESARQREQLSSTPFYGNRAAKYGQRYWVRMCASYRVCDVF
jgi:hypothetical protein